MELKIIWSIGDDKFTLREKHSSQEIDNEIDFKDAFRQAIEEIIESDREVKEEVQYGEIQFVSDRFFDTICKLHGWTLVYFPESVLSFKNKIGIDVQDVLDEYHFVKSADEAYWDPRVGYMEKESKNNDDHDFKHLQHRTEGKLIEKNSYVSKSMMSDGRYKISVIDPDRYWDKMGDNSADPIYYPNIVYTRDKKIADDLFFLYSSVLYNRSDEGGRLSSKGVYAPELLEINNFLEEKSSDIEIDYIDVLIKKPHGKYGGAYYSKKDMIMMPHYAIDHEIGHRKSHHTLDLTQDITANERSNLTLEPTVSAWEGKFTDTELSLIGPLMNFMREPGNVCRSEMSDLIKLMREGYSEELRATKNMLIEAMRSGKYTEEMKDKIEEEIVRYSGKAVNSVNGAKQFKRDINHEEAEWLVISWEKEFRDPMYHDVEEGMTEEELQQFYENNPEFEDAENWRKRNEEEGWINWNIDYREDEGKNNHCRKLRKEKQKTVVKRHIFRKKVSG